jgi:peptide/nickel transport system permease protein
MWRYVFFRFVQSLIVLLVVLFAVFMAARLTGDPVQLLYPLSALQTMTPADLEHVRHQLGLDQPLYVQYGQFLWHAVRGDFGQSFHWNEPALNLFKQRLPATLQLSLVAFTVSTCVSLPIGILAAVKRGTWIDSVARTFALAGQAIPNFWLAIMLILVFSVQLRWTPVFGRGGIDHMILPVISLGAFGSAAMIRLLRSSMLDVLESDYIKLARSKGLSERSVIWKHALRNAAIPVITIMGLQIARLASGSVIVETVYAWPGVGQLAVQALNARDFPVIQLVVTVVASMVLMANFFADMAYAVADPRIRRGGA